VGRTGCSRGSVQPSSKPERAYQTQMGEGAIDIARYGVTTDTIVYTKLEPEREAEATPAGKHIAAVMHLSRCSRGYGRVVSTWSTTSHSDCYADQTNSGATVQVGLLILNYHISS
jgi:hypothetical protein